MWNKVRSEVGYFLNLHGVVSFIVGISIVVGIYLWISVSGKGQVMSAGCELEYRRAQTAADTARVDLLVLGQRSNQRMTCGALRRASSQ